MDKLRSKPLAAQALPCAEATAQTSAQSGQGALIQPGAEKRSDVRYPVSANAVLIDHRSRTRLTARAADLSLGGCYLDAVHLLPVGVSVRLRLTAEAHTFECEAQVAYALQGLGMVLVFTKTSSEQDAGLRDWIAELSGENRSAMADDSLRTRQASSPSARPERRVPSQ